MTTRENDPSLWRAHLPKIKPGGHKYDRGVAVIYGAPKMTGATRLAAEACARIGAGLVKVVAPSGTGDIYRASLPAHIIVEDETSDMSKAQELLRDTRTRAFLMGPGSAPDPLYARLLAAAGVDDCCASVILDAGAFLSLKDCMPPGGANRVAVSPHEGEFKTFFGDDVLGNDKVAATEAAFQRLNATIVLKGARTVVAGNDDTVLQDRDVPFLSTGGTGDVLAGMIAGFAAQGMPLHPACAAAVWIHAEAAARFGPGLVAADLPDIIPSVLKELV